MDAAVSIVIILTGLLTMTWWIMKLTIRSELQQFKVDFIDYLNKQYVRRTECGLMHQDTNRRLGDIEQDA